MNPNTDLHALAQQHLTERQRRVLIARLNGHTYRRIADAYNIHEATARGHYQAALRRLEPHLRKDAA